MADIARRLADQFPSAGFARSAAYENLPSLARKGDVRRSQDGRREVYASTDKGLARLRDDLLRVRELPAIRDPVQAMLEFADRDDLRALIEMFAEDARQSRDATDLAHASLLSQQRRGAGGRSWRDEVQMLRLEDAALCWGDRAQRLDKLSEGLERIYRSAAS